MITEIVMFKLRDGLTRDQVVALYRETAPAWRANPELIRKNYLYDATGGRGGGVYLWRDIEAAKRAHSPAWLDKAEAMYGSRPEIQYFETPFVVDNLAQDIVGDAA